MTPSRPAAPPPIHSPDMHFIWDGHQWVQVSQDPGPAATLIPALIVIAAIIVTVLVVNQHPQVSNVFSNISGSLSA